MSVTEMCLIRAGGVRERFNMTAQTLRLLLPERI